MKKILFASLVCLATLNLVACSGEEKESDSSLPKVSSSSSSSESSSSSQSSDPHQAYQSLLQELGQKPDYQTSQYAFDDINKDGTDELLIKNSDVITEVFALQNNQPTSVISSLVALQGGARSGFSILTDGTIVQTSWQSTRPEATAVAYTLENGALKEGKTVTYDMTSQVEPAEALGLSGQELDANSLSWQDLATTSTASSNQAQPASTGMDINAIANGDFSSIAGTWQNAKGETLVFDKNGFASKDWTLSNISILPVSTVNPDGPYLRASANKASGEYVGGFFALPAGSTGTPLISRSNITEDAVGLAIAQPGQMTAPGIEESAFYYKVK